MILTTEEKLALREHEPVITNYLSCYAEEILTERFKELTGASQDNIDYLYEGALTAITAIEKLCESNVVQLSLKELIAA